MSIKSLSKETIKLINSTQVISSIYSAVKELVENSLDAGATNIEVNLTENGLSLIEVKDNGVGISREDTPYMALPSYTSKISDFNDLDLLSTYGFRGEGLTAVCQVSEVTVCTKTVTDETMRCYTLDYEGNVIASELSHGLTGTTVQMKNLFKNMPVRRNILSNKKRINQEVKAVELLLKTFAICKPATRFMYRVNSNICFTKPSCKNIQEALKIVLSGKYYSKLTYIKKCFDKTEIQLFVPKKEVKDYSEVSQVGLQFLCVNDRPIMCKEIEKKINKRLAEYFDQETSSSRKFVFCVTLKVDPSMLDVNLEPNKDKVFLQNEASVLDEIDKSLLTYYELLDSQLSTQNDIENINCNSNLSCTDEKKKTELEWPACKKRKIDSSQSVNICDVEMIDKNVLNGKHSADKSEKNFLNSINGPSLSESDSNDEGESNKNKSIINRNETSLKQIPENDSEESTIFDYDQKTTKTQIIEESLSQLPKVDLGEDFDWEQIIKDKNIVPENLEALEKNEVQQIPDQIWSKGQVPGLKGGVSIGFSSNTNNDPEHQKECQEEFQEDSELFDFGDAELIDCSEKIISDIPIVSVKEYEWDVNIKNSRKRTPTKVVDRNSKISKQGRKSPNSNIKIDSAQTQIPFAGGDVFMSAMGPSAFSMYCTSVRAKIVKEHPELNPAEVALYMNQQWKETSPEERAYYRDLAKEQASLNSSNVSISQTSKKSKPQISQAEKEKNRKKLVTMLENMKVNKTEAKNKTSIMRTSVPWNISLSLLTKRFREPLNKSDRCIVGSLNSSMWVIRVSSNLLVFDITKLLLQMNVKNYNLGQINAESVENFINQYFAEKPDMSIFYPLQSLGS